MTTTVQRTPAGDAPERPAARELDAQWVYDLGYARGVREAMATFRALEQAAQHLGVAPAP
jgi:hypothetical protein